MSYNAPPPPPPGSEPPMGYGMPQPPYGVQPRTSALAIVSLVTGILSFLCCGLFVFQIAAIVTGVLARKEIAQSAGTKTGDGLAKAGLICGIVAAVLAVVYWIVVVAAGLHPFQFSTSTSTSS